MADNNSEDVLLELKKSFIEERRELQGIIEDIETKIAQNKDYVSSLNKKEDCDYSIFSPRSASKVYKDRIYEKQTEIEELEEKLRVNYKKLSNVTKKLDSLNNIKLSVLKDEEPVVAEAPSSAESEVPSEQPSLTPVTEDRSLYIKLQEDDRRRIAADLHDGVLQNLSLVLHNIELAEKYIDKDPIRARLEMTSNKKLVKETIDEIRETIYNLRPMQFDDFGFKKALEDQLDSFKSRTDMVINHNIDDFENVDSAILITVFRFVQELVVNAIKHSGGSEVNIFVLNQKDKIYIEVNDNGRGLDVSASEKVNHFGLQIIKERVAFLNGKLSFPLLDRGCKVVIEIPF